MEIKIAKEKNLYLIFFYFHKVHHIIKYKRDHIGWKFLDDFALLFSPQ